jgi:hypothetical protein
MVHVERLRGFDGRQRCGADAKGGDEMQKVQFLRWWVSTAFDMAVPTKRPWMPRCSTVQPCWRRRCKNDVAIGYGPDMV